MKKIFFNGLIFLSVFSMKSHLVADASLVSQAEMIAPLVDNSGQERIAHIMSHVKHDIVPGNIKPISYVQVSNINQDLNIPAITDFFGCKTGMGNSFLQETLRRPVSPIDASGIVDLRVNAINALVKNPEFKRQVEGILENAAEQEKIAMELMANNFKAETCPELESLRILKEQKHVLYHAFDFMTKNRAWKTYNTITSALMLPMLWGFTGVSGYAAYDKEFNQTLRNAGLNLDSGVCTFYSVYVGLVAAAITYQFGKDLVNAGQKRVRMRALNQLIHLAESIENLSHKYHIACQFKMSLITDRQGVEVVEGLKASRYENETDHCFDVSAVHTFLYKIYENDTQLAQIFASIAEMDAYNAIATKILEAQNSDRQFCFAQKIESENPMVVSKSFWNLLVPGAVVNSMDINKHIILTGPNAGGKTTSIRAHLQNIILAQTYGIAAAEQFDYTQFDVILSYLNISDDLINGFSLFASEIKRAKDLLGIIGTLTPNQKLFFALDELFTGTAAEQGEKCAYEFIKKVSTFDQILFIYATHFDKLKELGKSNIGLMNYKVDAPIKNNVGKLVYPYTLSPGASTINIAEDMAKEAGLFD